MPQPSLSVVIPTCNRLEHLKQTLGELSLQEGLPGPIETVVVDDGSTDGTAEWLAENASELKLEVLRQSNQGPAAARNNGVEIARGSRILLLGDDARPAPGCLAEHLRLGGEDDLGILGRTDWDPEREVTRVMEFLAPEGPQFYFSGLSEGQNVSWTGVVSSNLSVPRRWLLEERFDVGFRHAAGEDTELAYRWSQRGFRTIFAPRAVCWHRHAYTELDPFLARQERAGRSMRRAVAVHPKMLWQGVSKPSLFGLGLGCAFVLRQLVGKSQVEDRWDLRCRWAFLKGFLRGT